MYYIYIYILYHNGFGGKIGQQKQKHKVKNFYPKKLKKNLQNQKVKY